MTYAGYYFCRKPFGQAKTPLSIHLDLSDTELAHIGTGFLVAYMVGQFLTALLAKRIACRRLLLVGMGASLACSMALGTIVDRGPEAYSSFFTLMIVNGVAQGTGWGACIGVMAHWFTRNERGTVLAFWATCYMLGSVAAKALASFILGLDTEVLSIDGHDVANNGTVMYQGKFRTGMQAVVSEGFVGDPAEVEISTGLISNDLDVIRRYQDMGVSRLIMAPPGLDEASVESGLAQFASDVIGKL